MVPEKACVVDLDKRYYKTVRDFEARFPQGPPSLRDAESLTVTGSWTFGKDVVVTGRARLTEPADGAASPVADGTLLT